MADPGACPPRPALDPCVLTKITFGQAIFTPAMLFTTDPPPNDRPYGGWLFLKATAARITPQGWTSLGLEVGVTGPPSFAGPLHRWFHRSLGKAEPMGWGKQIPFEPAFALTYAARRTWSAEPFGGSMSFQVEPRGSISLGTLRTGVRGGVFIRGGWNTPTTFDWQGPGPRTAFLFVGLGTEGELVLRDLFLDGSTWSQSAHAARVPLLGHLTGRIQMGLGVLALEFAATRSTVEFDGQDAPHTFGTVRIIVYP